MSMDLKELYQEVIIDHGRRPRNYRLLANANHHADGFNPLCGDEITVYMLIIDNIIEDISFQGSGCAISIASASLMTQELKGKTCEQASQLFNKFHNVLTEDIEADDSLGKLQILTGVREFPMRVKCATLAWHTLHNALVDDNTLACTEESE